MKSSPARRVVAYLVLTLMASLFFLVASEFMLQWYLKLPPRYLKTIIHYDAQKVPPKRVRANLDRSFIGAYREFKFHVTTTPDGFRTTYPQEINHGFDPSVILLGDSQTFGIGMDDERTYASLLSAKLGKPVLNAGCPGYNNIEEFLLSRELLNRFTPERVILFFFPGNDPYENFTNRRLLPGFANSGTAPLSHARAKSVYSLSRIKSDLIRNSALYNVATLVRGVKPVNDALYRLGLLNPQKPGELVVFERGMSERKTNFLEITDAALLQLNELTLKAGTRFLIVLIPDKYQIDPAYWQQWTQKYKLNPLEFNRLEPNQHLQEFSAAHGIEFLDVTPAFKEQHRQKKNLYWNRDHHLTADGNQVVADSVYEFLTA